MVCCVVTDNCTSASGHEVDDDSSLYGICARLLPLICDLFQAKASKAFPMEKGTNAAENDSNSPKNSSLLYQPADPIYLDQALAVTHLLCEMLRKYCALCQHRLARSPVANTYIQSVMAILFAYLSQFCDVIQFLEKATKNIVYLHSQQQQPPTPPLSLDPQQQQQQQRQQQHNRQSGLLLFTDLLPSACRNGNGDSPSKVQVLTDFVVLFMKLLPPAVGDNDDEEKCVYSEQKARKVIAQKDMKGIGTGRSKPLSGQTISHLQQSLVENHFRTSVVPSINSGGQITERFITLIFIISGENY